MGTFNAPTGCNQYGHASGCNHVREEDTGVVLSPAPSAPSTTVLPRVETDARTPVEALLVIDPPSNDEAAERFVLSPIDQPAPGADVATFDLLDADYVAGEPEVGASGYYYEAYRMNAVLRSNEVDADGNPVLRAPNGNRFGFRSVTQDLADPWESEPGERTTSQRYEIVALDAQGPEAAYTGQAEHLTDLTAMYGVQTMREGTVLSLRLASLRSAPTVLTRDGQPWAVRFEADVDFDASADRDV